MVAAFVTCPCRGHEAGVPHPVGAVTQLFVDVPVSAVAKYMFPAVVAMKPAEGVPSCTSSASSAPAPRSGCRAARVSASKMRICALLYSRELLKRVVSPGVGRRTISIAPTFDDCTKGNCSFVAPVRPLTIKLWNVIVEIPFQPLFALPVCGNPPVQLPAG